MYRHFYILLHLALGYSIGVVVILKQQHDGFGQETHTANRQKEQKYLNWTGNHHSVVIIENPNKIITKNNTIYTVGSLIMRIYKVLGFTFHPCLLNILIKLVHSHHLFVLQEHKDPSIKNQLQWPEYCIIIKIQSLHL